MTFVHENTPTADYSTLDEHNGTITHHDTLIATQKLAAQLAHKTGHPHSVWKRGTIGFISTGDYFEGPEAKRQADE